MKLKIWVNDLEDIGYDNPEIEFESYPSWNDDSYSDEFGLVKLKPYPTMASNGSVTWDKANYPISINAIIENWIRENKGTIDDLFCDALIKESKDY